MALYYFFPCRYDNGIWTYTLLSSICKATGNRPLNLGQFFNLGEFSLFYCLKLSILMPFGKRNSLRWSLRLQFQSEKWADMGTFDTQCCVEKAHISLTILWEHLPFWEKSPLES